MLTGRVPTFILLFTLSSAAFARSGVAIVGMGIFGPAGKDVAEFSKGLKGQRSGISSLRVLPDKPGNERFKFGAPVAYSNSDVVDQLRACPGVILTLARNPNTDRQSLFALKAAAEAMEDAGAIIPDRVNGGTIIRPDRKRVGVNVGSSLGGTMTDVSPGSKMLMGKMFRSPVQVVMGLGLEGEGACSTAACASGLHATIASARTLKAGDADMMLAGATEAQISSDFPGIAEAGYGLLSRAAILSPTGIPRPFDVQADGISLGEGAAIVTMTTTDYAEKHGYRVRSYVAGYAAITQARELTQLDRKLAAKSMSDAIENAGIKKEEVAAVWAHAPGTRIGNLAEGGAILDVFQEHKVPVVSLSSRVGHPLGPSGSMRIVAATLSLEGGYLPGNLFFETLPPELAGLNVVPARGMKLENARYVVVNSFGFGGYYSSVVIEKAEQKEH